MPRTCRNCRATEGTKHASWCKIDRPKPLGLGSDATDSLCELIGLFSQRGHAETKVVHPDNTVSTLPLTEYGDEVVKRAREVLKRIGREPIRP